jgi:4'-phosphopantetheinyl transferase
MSGAVGGPSVRVWVSRSGDDPRRLARSFALLLAAEVCGADPAGLRLEHAPDGRPVLPGTGVRVSISHTRGAVAVAAGVGAVVGVDVEVVRVLQVERLARRWLRAEEVAWLERQDAGDRSTSFLWLWTQKEALGKAAGRGLAGGAGLLREILLPEGPPPLGSAGPAGLRLGPVPGLSAAGAGAQDFAGLMVALAVRGDGAAGTVVLVEPQDARRAAALG